MTDASKTAAHETPRGEPVRLTRLQRRFALGSFARGSLARGSFARGEEGVAAVEFALILPLLLSLWFGFTILGQVQGRTTMINNGTAMVADMVAQGVATSRQDLGDSMRAAELTMRPEDAALLQMSVIGVRIPARDPSTGRAGTPTVEWSLDNKGRRVFTKGSPYESLPTAVRIPGVQDRMVIVSEGGMNYRPGYAGKWFANAVIGPFDLKHVSIYAPRNSTLLLCGDCP